MAPRYMERMSRQSATLKAVFGSPSVDPPPYPVNLSKRNTEIASRSSRSSDATCNAAPPQCRPVNDGIPDQSDDMALPRDSLILVTGANGWQGTHIVDQLLGLGYRVRGTVRDAQKAAWTFNYFSNRYSIERYSAVIVPDMTVKGAFDVCARGCAGIIHVASVTTLSPVPDQVIIPSIAGALNALEAAVQAPRVRRFVYCSAISAAVPNARGRRNEITSESWNMFDFDEAWAPPPYEADRAPAVYASSKMQTEQAVWKWYHDRRPRFTLSTVLSDYLWGKTLDSAHQAYPPSMLLLKSIFEGSSPAAPPAYFVDVQDSAILHVAALLCPDVRQERIFAACTPWNVSSVAQLMGELFPGKVKDVQATDTVVDMTVFRESHRAEQLLKRMGRQGWTDIETSVTMSCEAFS